MRARRGGGVAAWCWQLYSIQVSYAQHQYSIKHSNDKRSTTSMLCCSAALLLCGTVALLNCSLFYFTLLYSILHSSALH
jgi:hypothetical protein